MEEKRLLKGSDRGTALLVVLTALVILMPLSLLVSVAVLRWQQEANGFRQLTQAELTAQAAYHQAALRIQRGGLDLVPGELRRTRMWLSGHPVRLMVSRQPDVVVSRNGEILEARDLSATHLEAVGMDLRYHRVRLHQKLELYLIEARVATNSLPTVRLWAVLLRAPGGPFQQAGLRIDRVYEPTRKRRLHPTRIEKSSKTTRTFRWILRPVAGAMAAGTVDLQP